MSEAAVNSEMIQTLDTAWAKPLSGSAPKQLIIFLHGVGADGNDLLSLAHEIAPEMPDAQFLSPNAPFPYDMAPMGYQWFSLQQRDPELLLDGARACEPILNKFIDDQLKIYNLPEEKLGIVSFSQGSMMAMHTMLRRPNACGAMACFSGALIGGNVLKDEITSKPPVCLIHGEMDDVVPFEAMALASEALTEASVEHQTQACPNVGHGIDPRGLLTAVNFLKAKLL